jgi:hypothetical protein
LEVLGMEFTLTESAFGAPQGVYLATFVGVENKTHPDYGPGVEWRFQIAEGIHKGKIVSRTTSLVPTLKNACGRMLADLIGGPVPKGHAVKVDQYRGRLYQVVIEANSTGNGTRIGKVLPPPNGAPAAAPAAPSAPPAPLVPPAPPAPPPPPPADGDTFARKYWTLIDNKTIELSGAEIHAHLKKTSMLPRDLRVRARGESGDWKTAADYGLDVPY